MKTVYPLQTKFAGGEGGGGGGGGGIINTIELNGRKCQMFRAPSWRGQYSGDRLLKGFYT